MVEVGDSDNNGGEKKYVSFETARETVREFQLKNKREWFEYHLRMNEIKDEWDNIEIPANPDRIYRNNGWRGWSDWLGTNIPKQKLTLTINKQIIDRAKKEGLNISELTEQILDILTYEEHDTRKNLVSAYESFFGTVRSLLNKYGIAIEVGKMNDKDSNIGPLLLLTDNMGLVEGNDRASAKPIDVPKVLRFLFNPNIILENLLLEIMQCERKNKEKIVELKFATKLLMALFVKA